MWAFSKWCPIFFCLRPPRLHAAGYAQMTSLGSPGQVLPLFQRSVEDVAKPTQKTGADRMVGNTTVDRDTRVKNCRAILYLKDEVNTEHLKMKYLCRDKSVANGSLPLPDCRNGCTVSLMSWIFLCLKWSNSGEWITENWKHISYVQT